jgi:hypothetical protein
LGLTGRVPSQDRESGIDASQKHKDETLRTLVDLTEAAARPRPSVMLFQNAHWADPTTLEVLDLLITVSNRAVADGALPPAGVSIALVRARTCRRIKPVQADPNAARSDGLLARRWQGRQGRPGPRPGGGGPLDRQQRNRWLLETASDRD